MEIRQELSQRLVQKLVLTPQLQMAIRLLLLSRMELVQEVRKQLETNPVLEEDSSDSDAVSLEETLGAREAEGPRLDGEERGDSESSERPRSPLEDGDISAWRRFVEGYRQFSGQSSSREDVERLPGLESTVARKTSLYDHLLWQLNLSDLDDFQKRVGAFIIGNLDRDGYLREFTSQEIAREMGCSVESAEEVIVRLQTFDPVGVCARDLKECLLVQARTYYPDNLKLQLLVQNHLHDLERRNVQKIARSLECSLEEVKELVLTIQSMEPRPGRAFSTDDVIYVQPDVYVFKVGSDYVTVVNDNGLPRLRISQYYERMLHQELPKEARDFVQEKLRSALWLIRSIHQRQSTIRKVTESIVRFQRPFLEKGIKYLKPLVLRDVADDIGMHESTVSRVTTNKYVHTPQGLYELKFFFKSKVGSKMGEMVSSEAVRARIREMIDSEDPHKPLSDSQIASLLRKEGMLVARRTVAKYREQMGIAPSSRRKALL